MRPSTLSLNPSSNGGVFSSGARNGAVLEVGEWDHYQFWAEIIANIGINVRSVDGGPTDIWLIDGSDMDAYRDGDEIDFHRGISQAGVSSSAELSGQLLPGEYSMIVDNSTAFGEAGESSTTVELRAGIRL